MTDHRQDLSGDAWRVSLLSRLLRKAAASGSDRGVILAWAQAMAVWHNLEVHAYVDDMRGHYVHEAALPSADVAAAPPVIEAATLENAGALTPLGKPDADRLHFTTGENVVLCRVGEARGWLLAVSGALSPEAGAALPVYVRLLDEAVVYATLVSVSRSTGAIVGHLFGDDEHAPQHASLAMDALRQALGLKVASLIVRSAAGAPVITIGDWPGAALNTGNPGSRLVVLRHAVDRYSLALGVAKPDGRQVTPQEATVVEKVADILELWAQRLVWRTADALERRASPRRFDDFIEGLAAQALDRDVPVTALVVSLRARSFAAFGMECAARLRNSVRASDLVGMLSDNEIGLLLYNTLERGGRLVEMRVHEVLRSIASAAGTTVDIVVGFAARVPRDASASPILQDARAQARQRLTAERR